MAKTTPDIAVDIAPISAKTQKMIDGIKRPFVAFVSDYKSLLSSRAELAPRFMKAYGAWQSESGGTFVAFVRVLDPSIPVERNAYRAHVSYQAADYLRRLVARQQAEKEGRKVVNPAEVPATPLEALARLVSSVLPLVPNADILWKAFVEELHWTDNQVKRVQSLVTHSEALLRPTAAHPKPALRAVA